MKNSRIIQDIWEQKAVEGNQDISEILSRYSLSPSEKEAVNRYVSSIDTYLTEGKSGSPSIEAYWKQHGPIIAMTTTSSAILGTLIGGVLGYLTTNDMKKSLDYAALGGLLGTSAEFVLKPIARACGVPKMKSISGSLESMVDARVEVERAFSD